MQHNKDEFKNDTPVHAPLKFKYRQEMRKLKEMPPKKKMEYIWEYYKFHITIIILILAILGGIINATLINPRPHTALFISWNTGYATDDQLRTLSDMIKERVVDEKANEAVETVLFFPTTDDPSMDAANIQRLAAMLAAGMIDVFIIDSVMFEDYAFHGYLQPMDHALETIRAQNPTAYSRIAENIIRADFTTREGDVFERIMGIDISDNRLLDEIGFFEFEKIFCFSITASNVENATSALMLLFE